MSQPFNQREVCPALGELDESIGEFWLENPWEADENNLSAFEQNFVLMNVGQGRFIDVSHLSHANLDSDSRAVAVGDLDNDGDLDLFVRSSGGGPLQIFENHWATGNWIHIQLEGRQSNRQGIGAKVIIKIGKKIQSRENYPINSFLSQLPPGVHFGTGTATEIDEILIHWPSGETQSLKSVSVNQSLTIIEGSTEQVSSNNPKSSPENLE